MDFSAAIAEVIHLMGLNPLKSKQTESLKAFVSGRDTFVALPTGYGKSIIFAVLPLLFDKMLSTLLSLLYISRLCSQYTLLYCSYIGVQGTIVVVITPLISLMIDQQEKFSKKGISVEFVGGAQDRTAAVTAVLKGQIQLVYISPENLLKNPCFRNMLTSDRYRECLRALVVDEAHCVKLW